MTALLLAALALLALVAILRARHRRAVLRPAPARLIVPAAPPVVITTIDGPVTERRPQLDFDDRGNP